MSTVDDRCLLVKVFRKRCYDFLRQAPLATDRTLVSKRVIAVI